MYNKEQQDKVKYGKPVNFMAESIFLQPFTKCYKLYAHGRLLTIPGPQFTL